MTKQLSIEKDVYVKLQARAREKDMTPNEYAVKIIHEMIDKEEFERITIFAPKILLRLMKEKHYFGTPKEAFLITCLQRGIDCELAELPICRKLEEEYQVNIDWADVWLSIHS